MAGKGNPVPSIMRAERALPEMRVRIEKAFGRLDTPVVTNTPKQQGHSLARAARNRRQMDATLSPTVRCCWPRKAASVAAP